MAARNATMDDYLYVINWGEIVSVEEDPEQHNHKCKITGKDIDGEDLTLVVALLEKEPAVLCITVHG